MVNVESIWYTVGKVRPFGGSRLRGVHHCNRADGFFFWGDHAMKHVYDEFLKMALDDEIKAAIKSGDRERAEALTRAAEGVAVQARQRRKAVLSALRRASLPQPELSATGE